MDSPRAESIVSAPLKDVNGPGAWSRERHFFRAAVLFATSAARAEFPSKPAGATSVALGGQR